MATIYVENVYARLFGDLTSIVKAESVCTYTLKSGQSRSLSAKRTTEGGAPFLVFPAGLVRRVIKATRAEVVDRRTPPPWSWNIAEADWLRDYQVEALETFSKRTRCLLRSPTGSGKGEIVAGVIAAAREGRWLILTPRTSLVNDLKKRTHMKAGVCPVALGIPFSRPGVRIATYAGAAKMVKAAPQVFKDFDGIICDEAHQVAAVTYYKVIKACTNAYWRLGLSATPTERTDGKSIYVVGAFGDPITLAEYDELVQRGSITDYEVKWVPVEGVEMPSGRYGFARMYDVCIVRNQARNRAILREVMACEKPAFLFTERVSHAEAIYKKLTELGVRAALATKNTSKGQRETIILAAKEGDVDVIVSTRVFAEGVDIPNIRTTINAAGLKAPIALLQRIGRGSRLAAGKYKFTHVEFAESCGFGAKHAKARAQTLQDHHGK
jgi:superfamily II DNA or RNA helicase